MAQNGNDLTTRIRLAKWFGVTFFAFGLFDVVFRVMAVGGDGFVWSLHDPGKIAFHLLILPIATALLVFGASHTCIATAWREQKPVLLSLLVIVFSLIAGFSVVEGVRGLCERQPMPYDVTGENATVLAKHFAAGEKPEYDMKVDEIRGDDCGLRIFMESSSVRAKYAVFLTFLGISTAGALLVLLILHPITRTRLEGSEFDLLLVVSSLMCVWFALRAYSEWYINFRKVNDSYDPFLPAAFCAFFVFVLLPFVRKTSDLRSVLTWGGITTLAGAIAAAYTFWAEKFGPVADKVAGLGTSYIIMLYLILALGLGTAALHTFRVAAQQYDTRKNPD